MVKVLTDHRALIVGYDIQVSREPRAISCSKGNDWMLKTNHKSYSSYLDEKLKDVSGFLLALKK